MEQASPHECSNIHYGGQYSSMSGTNMKHVDIIGRHGKTCSHADISWDCRIFFRLQNLIFLQLFQILWKFNHNTHIVHINAHLNPLKCLFIDKLLLIVEIFNNKFEEILNCEET